MPQDEHHCLDLWRRNMAALLRDDLHAYMHRAFLELYPGTPFLPAMYIRAMCHQLERVERGEVKRLLLLVPPRHLKSHCASVALSTWYLGRHPTKTVVGASYNADLAQTFSGLARRLMEAPWHRAVFPELVLDPRKASAEELRIRNHGGRRLATSVGGTFTGKGADLIIIDDPMKADDAFSETRREDVYHWVTTTVISRFNDPKAGALIVVAQRLHGDDLPGRLIAAGGWEVLELPAIAPHPAEYEIANGLVWPRRKGELLDSHRIDRPTLEQLRRELGTHAFEAQYQQRPTPPEGNLIRTEWFGAYEKALPRRQYEAVVQSWDPAAVPGSSNDYSVCTTWGLNGRHIDLLHVHRARHGFPELLQAALRLRQDWTPDLVVVEASHTGSALVQELNSRRYREVRGSAPRGAKEERMAALTPFLERGEVRVPASAPWLEAFLAECGAFPNGRYDDQVDTLSQLLDAVRRQPGEIRHLSRYRKAGG